MGVVVFGSINMDLVVRAPRLPDCGEPLLGHSFFTAPGGKGANQAVAAARMGATASMVGRVGSDVFGAMLPAALQADQVDTAGVTRDPDHASGVALITIVDNAENRIIGVPGANSALDEPDLPASITPWPGRGCCCSSSRCRSRPWLPPPVWRTGVALR